MQIYGIGATESLDRTGERISLQGMDISEIKLFNDEHESNTFFQILGRIHLSKKIFSQKDCDDQYQLKCWNLVQKPFLYVFGELAGPEHPNAAAAGALIRYSVKHPQYPVGLSVEGGTVRKNGNVLEETKVMNISLTVKPANTECRVFPVMDLNKSFGTPELPEKYKNVIGRKQFRNKPTNHQILLAKSELATDLKELATLPEPEIKGATIIRCWNCGCGKLFMKSRLPNRCVACSEAFTMSDIYKARIQTPQY